VCTWKISLESMLPPMMIESGCMPFAAICAGGDVLWTMLMPASELRPAGHVPCVAEQIVGSEWMLGVERKDARWMSFVRRFIASVSASCALEMRASCWKNVVAFFESMNAAIETRTPALSATSTSTSVKPIFDRRGHARLMSERAIMRLSDGRVVLEHGGHEVHEAVAADLVVGGE